MNKALSTFLILVALMLHTTLYAQQYPFGATIVVQPPYSPYLSHYADGQDAKLLVVVTPNDNNFVQRECVMQFRIKGQGFECETDVNKLFNLPSIQLVGGMSKTLMSYEYTPYLQPSDLVFKRGALVRGAIPQGLTQISVQIFDKATHLPLSAEHSDVFNLSLSNPPMLNMPFDKENIPVQMFQNINFSWTPLHMGSINAAFSTEYLFELWEIYNEQVPAQQYVQTAQPLYSTTTNSPILIYGPTMPMLIEGKRYAWRVRVQAKKGFDYLELFTNNGYSQVWSFAYAANCPEPSQVLLTSPFPDQIKVQWAYQNTYQQMKISYREAGKSKWYHETTTDPEYYITQLKDNTEYEVKIAGICTGDVETYSQPATIKTQEKGKTQIPNFNCGTPPKKLDLSNKAPLASLNAGETVTAGDFEITITEARGGGGTYSGKGYMRVPYFKLARLAITFQNVQINTSRQLIGGYFQAVYDEANGTIVNTTGVVEAIGEAFKALAALFDKYDKKIDDAKNPEELQKVQEEIVKELKPSILAFYKNNISDVKERLKKEEELNKELSNLTASINNNPIANSKTQIKTLLKNEKAFSEGLKNQIEKEENNFVKAYSLYRLNDAFKALFVVKCQKGEFKLKGNEYRFIAVEWENKTNKPLKFKKIGLESIESIKIDDEIRKELNSEIKKVESTSGDFSSLLQKSKEIQTIKVANKIQWCAYPELSQIGKKICELENENLDAEISKDIVKSIDNCYKNNEEITKLKFLPEDKIKTLYRGYSCETRPPPCEGDINNVGQIYSKGKWVYGQKDKYVSFPIQPFDKTKLQTELGINPNDVRFEYYDNGPMNNEGTWYKVFYPYKGTEKEIGLITIHPLNYNSTPSDWKNYYKAQSPEIFPKEADDLKKNPFYFYIILQEDLTLIYSKGKHELLKTILEVACGNKWNTSAAKETIGADLADKADNSTNLNLQIAQTRWQSFKTNKVKIEEEIFEVEGKGVQGAGNSLSFLNGWTKQSIITKVSELKAIGQKLNPTQYLSPTYITTHLNKFKTKASYLVTGDTYDNFILGKATVGRPDGLFISTAKDIDAVIAKANGNISIIEQELGIPAGSWQGKGGIVRIDINNPENFNLRIPDGSEAGANALWEPGGLTSGGKVEAVTNPIPNANINANKIIQ